MIDRDITHLYAPFAESVARVIVKARQMKMQIGLYEGYRSFERQAELLAIGRPLPWAIRRASETIVTKSFPGVGLHGYGLAADIVFNPEHGFADGWSESYPWQKLGALAEGAGLQWGGKFQFRDYCHVEWKIPTNYDLKKRYIEVGLTGIWKELDEYEKK